MSSSEEAAAPKKLSFREVMEKSAASAARGGVAGACAMGANVAALMWIRTTVRASRLYHRCFDIVIEHN